MDILLKHEATTLYIHYEDSSIQHLSLHSFMDMIATTNLSRLGIRCIQIFKEKPFFGWDILIRVSFLVGNYGFRIQLSKVYLCDRDKEKNSHKHSQPNESIISDPDSALEKSIVTQVQKLIQSFSKLNNCTIKYFNALLVVDVHENIHIVKVHKCVYVETDKANNPNNVNVGIDPSILNQYPNNKGHEQDNQLKKLNQPKKLKKQKQKEKGFEYLNEEYEGNEKFVPTIEVTKKNAIKEGLQKHRELCFYKEKGRNAAGLYEDSDIDYDRAEEFYKTFDDNDYYDLNPIFQVDSPNFKMMNKHRKQQEKKIQKVRKSIHKQFQSNRVSPQISQPHPHLPNYSKPNQQLSTPTAKKYLVSKIALNTSERKRNSDIRHSISLTEGDMNHSFHSSFSEASSDSHKKLQITLPKTNNLDTKSRAFISQIHSFNTKETASIPNDDLGDLEINMKSKRNRSRKQNENKPTGNRTKHYESKKGDPKTKSISVEVGTDMSLSNLPLFNQFNKQYTNISKINIGSFEDLDALNQKNSKPVPPYEMHRKNVSYSHNLSQKNPELSYQTYDVRKPLKNNSYFNLNPLKKQIQKILSSKRNQSEKSKNSNHEIVNDYTPTATVSQNSKSLSRREYIKLPIVGPLQLNALDSFKKNEQLMASCCMGENGEYKDQISNKIAEIRVNHSNGKKYNELSQISSNLTEEFHKSHKKSQMLVSNKSLLEKKNEPKKKLSSPESILEIHTHNFNLQVPNPIPHQPEEVIRTSLKHSSMLGKIKNGHSKSQPQNILYKPGKMQMTYIGSSKYNAGDAVPSTSPIPPAVHQYLKNESTKRNIIEDASKKSSQSSLKRNLKFEVESKRKLTPSPEKNKEAFGKRIKSVLTSKRERNPSPIEEIQRNRNFFKTSPKLPLYFLYYHSKNASNERNVPNIHSSSKIELHESAVLNSHDELRKSHSQNCWQNENSSCTSTEKEKKEKIINENAKLNKIVKEQEPQIFDIFKTPLESMKDPKEKKKGSQNVNVNITLSNSNLNISNSNCVLNFSILDSEFNNTFNPKINQMQVASSTAAENSKQLPTLPSISKKIHSTNVSIDFLDKGKKEIGNRICSNITSKSPSISKFPHKPHQSTTEGRSKSFLHSRKPSKSRVALSLLPYKDKISNILEMDEREEDRDKSLNHLKVSSKEAAEKQNLMKPALSKLKSSKFNKRIENSLIHSSSKTKKDIELEVLRKEIKKINHQQKINESNKSASTIENKSTADISSRRDIIETQLNPYSNYHANPPMVNSHSMATKKIPLEYIHRLSYHTKSKKMLSSSLMSNTTLNESSTNASDFVSTSGQTKETEESKNKGQSLKHIREINRLNLLKKWCDQDVNDTYLIGGKKPIHQNSMKNDLSSIQKSQEGNYEHSQPNRIVTLKKSKGFVTTLKQQTSFNEYGQQKFRSQSTLKERIPKKESNMIKKFTKNVFQNKLANLPNSFEEYVNGQAQEKPSN